MSTCFFVVRTQCSGTAHVPDRHRSPLVLKHRQRLLSLPDEPQFENVNVREMVMLKEVLPKLETFLDEMCKGFFRLPMPKVQHCYYDGKGDYDCFVLDNLLDEDYYNFSNEKCLNEDHMKASWRNTNSSSSYVISPVYLKAVLDCLSYLHGTGLAYKHSTGGREVLLREFPRLEVSKLTCYLWDGQLIASDRFNFS